jgi:hypothetical protein
MAGNSSRLAKALRSAADGFAAEVATSSIASRRPVSQTRYSARMLAEIGPLDFPVNDG